MASSPATLDPGVGTDEASQKIGQLLFSSLLKIDDALRVVPDLAVRFETADSQVYVAEIPSGVRFHDGRELTAEDVAYTFRRFLDPSFTSARKGAYGELASVEVRGPYVVAFHLKQPSASFPINLVMGIVPQGTGAEAGRRPVGSGPYRLAEFAPDDHVTLEAFDGHFRGAPRNSGLVIRTVPDDTMRGLELRKGSVDIVVNDLSPDLVHGLDESTELAVVTAPGTDYAYVGLNLRDPVLADRRVRQAIAWALDVDAICEYLRRGLARPATSIVPPMSWAYEPDATRYRHDPARAMALLDEAGYRDPDGAGPEPRLRLSLKTSTAEAYRLQATVIQSQLAGAGIAVELRSQELTTLLDDVRTGNMQMYTLQFVGITDPDILRRVFHSTQVPPNGLNRAFYANPDVDRLIDEATASLDDATRLRLYRRVQALVAGDLPIISLWTKVNVAVSQPNLRGITLSPIADFAFLANVRRQ
jgi:peptide/nickel transport system substrate-binding protein